MPPKHETQILFWGSLLETFREVLFLRGCSNFLVFLEEKWDQKIRFPIGFQKHQNFSFDALCQCSQITWCGAKLLEPSSSPSPLPGYLGTASSAVENFCLNQGVPGHWNIFLVCPPPLTLPGARAPPGFLGG